MSLLKAWAPLFRAAVRNRGRAYQSQGRVRQIQPGAGELARAVVWGGSRDHLVVVKAGADGERAEASCTCAYFAGGQYCKHIWALLLDVHYRGVLGVGTGGGDAGLGGKVPAMPKARRRVGAEEEQRREGLREPEWLGRLRLVRPRESEGRERAGIGGLAGEWSQVFYVIDLGQSQERGAVVVEVRQRRATRTGWGRLRAFELRHERVGELVEAVDRELCALIVGAREVAESEREGGMRLGQGFVLPEGAQRMLVRRMVETGRCLLRGVGREERGGGELRRLVWDGLEAWVLWLVGRWVGQSLEVRAELRRGGERMEVTRPELVVGGEQGLVFYGRRVAPLEDGGGRQWLEQFREEASWEGRVRPICVPRGEVGWFLDQLYGLANLPEIELPKGLGREERLVAPRPRLELYRGGGTGAGGAEVRGWWGGGPVLGRLWFDYEGELVTPGQAGRYVVKKAQKQVEEGAGAGEEEAGAEGEVAGEAGGGAEQEQMGQVIRRDLRREREAVGLLAGLGFRPEGVGAGNQGLVGQIGAKDVLEVIERVLEAGWDVYVERQAVRRAGSVSLSVRSGVDWFELRGGVKFQRADGQEEVVAVQEILEAAEQGRGLVKLSDGSEGLVPRRWLAEQGLAMGLGRVEEGAVRFSRAQLPLVDRLLAESSRWGKVEADEILERGRGELSRFGGIEPLEAGAGFCGVLRPYQRFGLGWLAFLRRLGLGGILADDMGLGKTVQVLAMLERLYGSVESGGWGGEPDLPGRPTLVVAPKSVVFNWVDEAARFTPGLRVQAYTGADRQSLREAFADYHVIVTTYGLMRRDIEALREQEFGYVILDEAQAIKNPQSQVAKAARLLRGRHRLALTGTPVENHLGDLWSIFEFLNPGMLGGSGGWERLVRRATGRGTEEEGRLGGQRGAMTGRNLRDVELARELGAVLRPFILRRTKGQVLSDLPEKTEQTIVCQMEGRQLAMYQRLLGYYRGQLLAKVEAVGIERSTFMVLEALLRLRQAACHPGLIDPGLAEEPAAKVEAILERLEEIVEEGHKALVFSQFTSFLALVRRELDRRGWVYGYLDGQTRRRKKVVQRFQEDPACGVFLISLKAGGLGLNLTAADYVFILDPWWNPAAESQAIDRAHRIGQSRRVFAYRLISKDTVEQRIAELQEHKRQLAEAIVGQQESLLRNLTREDLERLLS